MGNASYYEDVRNRIDDALFMQGMSVPENARDTVIQATVDRIREIAPQEQKAKVDLRKRVAALQEENCNLRRDAAAARKRLQAMGSLLSRAEKLISELTAEKQNAVRLHSHLRGRDRPKKPPLRAQESRSAHGILGWPASIILPPWGSVGFFED